MTIGEMYTTLDSKLTRLDKVSTSYNRLETIVQRLYGFIDNHATDEISSEIEKLIHNFKLTPACLSEIEEYLNGIDRATGECIAGSSQVAKSSKENDKTNQREGVQQKKSEKSEQAERQEDKQTKKARVKLCKSPQFWVLLILFVILMGCHFLSLIPNISKSTQKILHNFGAAGDFGTIICVIFAFKEHLSGNFKKRRSDSGPETQINMHFRNVIIIKKLNYRIARLSQNDAVQELEDKLNTGNILVAQREFRKAKKIFKECLKTSCDINIYFGLLKASTKEGGEWGSKETEKWILAIEYLIYQQKSFSEPEQYNLYLQYREKYNEFTKRLVSSKARNIYRCQQVATWTVLLLPTIFAVVEGILFCELPIKADFIESNAGIFFWLVAFTCVAIFIMGFVLWYKDANDNYDGFGIDVNGLGAIAGALLASACLTILSLILSFSVSFARIALLPFVWIFAVVGLAGVVISIILSIVFFKKIIDEGKLSISRFVLCLFAAISFGFSIGCFVYSTNFSGGDDKYEINSDGTYTYTILRDNTEVLKIPSMHNGKPVTRVTRTYLGGIWEYVETPNLKTVFIPSSIKEIDDCAFGYSPNLEEITFDNSNGDVVMSVDSDAFNGCENLKKVNITNLKTWCNIEFDGYEANPLYYAHNLYSNNNLVTTITAEMLQGVTKIKNHAFDSCTSLTNITIPDSVTSIGIGAFADCGAVRKENGVSYVDKWAIGYDNTVTDVQLSANTVGIADYAFEGLIDKSINSVTFNEELKYIGKSSFYGTDVSQIVIPQSVVSIGNSAFAYCRALSSVTLNEGLRNIGRHAFEGCTQLKNINFNNNINDWYYYEEDDAIVSKGRWILSSDLSNPATAATYLTSTYCNYYWKREGN